MTESMRKRGRGALGIVLITIFVPATGCTDFFIAEALAPNADHEYEQGGGTLQSGTLDVLFARSYGMALEVHASGRSGVRVEGANVRIWRGGQPQGAEFYSFYQPGLGYVNPDSSSVLFFEDILPGQAVGALLQYAIGVAPDELTLEDMLGYRDLITLGITVLGTDDNDNEVETQEIYFTVYLCAGCLVTCPPESIGEDPGSYCESTTPPEASPCRLGQDEEFDCRFCVPYYSAADCRLLCSM